jgi:hypothetical protein
MSAKFLTLIIVIVAIISYKFYHDNLDKNPDFKMSKVTFLKNDKAYFDLEVKVANTPATREKGLMFVSELAKNKGMLFIYDNIKVVRMWMKNTFISLDMIFIDENFVIKHISKGTMPGSLNQISSIVPVKYVIEVNAGVTDKYKININDKIEIIEE